MAKRFRPVLRDQPMLLPPDMREWLPAGHLAWFVIEVAESLDLSRFAARPGRSAAGRAAYDPRVLLGLLVYGYSTGVRSSRRIERACAEDVAFRVICAQDAPDHATIARFRREHFADPAAMQGLFAQVLALAAGAGLGRLGLIALDGTKIAASASKDANRSPAKLAELAAQLLAEAEAADAAEDALYGDARGDELPPELADPVTRRDRIRRAAADLEAGRRAGQEEADAQAGEFRRRQRAGKPTGPWPARAAVQLAGEQVERLKAAQQAKIEDWHARDAARRQATGRGLTGCPPVPPGQHCRVRKAEAKLARAGQAAAAAAEKETARRGAGQVRNITDPDSRLMPVRGGGFIQGYNAQAVHSADGLCLGGLVTTDTTDYASFIPLLASARDASALLREHARGPLHRLRARIGTALADAGYLSEANLTSPGPDRLIATGKNHDPAQNNRRGGDPAAAMAARLAALPDKATYRQRSPIAEGPFGNTKHNRGFRTFSMRGLTRANGEWTFQNTTANLLKIHATRPRPARA
jgi:transposase